MTRVFPASEAVFGPDPTIRWKRAGVAWAAICLNFSLWGAILWALDIV